MSLDLACLQEDFPDLNPIPIIRGQWGIRYRLQLPAFPCGREFARAELLLPRGFPEQATAKIMLSPDAVLRIPHVDGDGGLCIEGDPGPSQGYSPEDRVRLLLIAYQEKFLAPWLAGNLDEDFVKEPLNYWLIEVGRARSMRDPISAVWTIDDCPSRPTVKEGLLLLPDRIVIATAGQPITTRIIQSIGAKSKQLIRVLVADIPISHIFTPSTWPRSMVDLDRLLKGRLHPEQQKRFKHPLRKRGRGVHRIVLLRNPTCGFAYLLPGGPPTMVDNGMSKRAYPSRTSLLPLSVTRIDPSWTVGRDQHPEVTHRQKLHILVLGAGALGSSVVDHLAKAGVGFITLVDTDILSPANIGRHMLGADFIGQPKADAVANKVNLGHPSTIVTPLKMSAEQWLYKYTLSEVSLVLDLTGEPDVRWHVNQARKQHSCPLLIGWMEPFVAAAHVCLLPAGQPWMDGTTDQMEALQAVTWPDEVIRWEPGCSSQFQSYTAAAAAHAIALVVENALILIDSTTQEPRVISWVRGQRFLDNHWQGLTLREWSQPAAPHDGLVMERSFP